MPLIQPPVGPLPPGIDLSGQTVIVTGASSGIGLELCRQLLVLKVSTLVFAVRNVAKGESVKTSLQAEPGVASANPKANIEVMKLDTEDYDSVKEFSAAFRLKFSELHVLMLNAGIGTWPKEYAKKTGHEKDVQVNYLSNVLLTLELLPTLEATAEKVGSPTRITWTSSRMYNSTTLSSTAPKPGETVLGHLKAADVGSPGRYGNSKLLAVVFQRELAEHYSSNKVIINGFCPGMVHSGMGDVLPFPLRVIQRAVFAVRARAPEKGGWIGLNAALVAGPETHGKLLVDKEIDKTSEFVKSEAGRKVQKMLWNETVDEMKELITLPSWMSKV